MARRRLNDTAALVMAGNAGEGSHSISTEKIDGGWLVRTSRCDPRTGEYSSTTEFSATPPRIIPGRIARSPAPGSESLRDTVDYLRRGD